jgi:hypothetical protein
MDEPLEYASMDDWPLRWRFAEDATRWTVLPDADMRQFLPLTESCSHDQWHRLVTPAVHLIAAGGLRSRIAAFQTSDDWTSAEETIRVGEYLRRHVPIQEDASLLFFWGMSCAVETTWDILLRYWTDFCYPLDSNVAIPLDSEHLVAYHEGAIWTALRGVR